VKSENTRVDYDNKKDRLWSIVHKLFATYDGDAWVLVGGDFNIALPNFVKQLKEVVADFKTERDTGTTKDPKLKDITIYTSEGSVNLASATVAPMTNQYDTEYILTNIPAKYIKHVPLATVEAKLPTDSAFSFNYKAGGAEDEQAPGKMFWVKKGKRPLSIANPVVIDIFKTDQS
jgi:hypothetical protein